MRNEAVTKLQVVIIVAILAVAGIAGAAYYLTLPKSEQESEPIRIGYVASLSGSLGTWGKKLQNAYNLWRDQINAQGGLLGRTVEFTYYDDESVDANAATLMERLITEDKVDVLLGAMGTGPVYAASTVTEKYGMIFVTSGASSPSVYARGYKYLFCSYPGTSDQLTMVYMDYLSSLAAGKKPSTVAYIGQNTLYGKSGPQAGTLMGIAKHTEFTLVSSELYEASLADFKPLLTKIQGYNPDLLVCGTYSDDGRLILNGLKEIGWCPKLLYQASFPAIAEYVNITGKTGDYVTYGSFYETMATFPGQQEFIQLWKGKTGVDPDYTITTGYAACQIVQQAINATKSLNNTVLRDYITAHHFDTVTGPFEFGENGVNKKPNFLIVQYQNLSRVLLYPTEVATGQLVYPAPTWDQR